MNNHSFDPLSLPEDVLPSVTCCFTGHRHIAESQQTEIIRTTEYAVRRLIGMGYRYFIAGGAEGYDMLAERVVIRAAETHPEVKLILALPCRDQTRNWLRAPGASPELIREYQRLKGEAAVVLYITDFYRDGCMKERNQFMVDHSGACIAFYREKSSPRSGTGQTVRMAQRAGLQIYNINRILTGETDGDHLFGSKQI